jgi:hypothetical protein
MESITTSSDAYPFISTDAIQKALSASDGVTMYFHGEDPSFPAATQTKHTFRCSNINCLS